MTTEPTPTEFLLARYAEEEDGVAALREDGVWEFECHPVSMEFWLADVEAKRAILQVAWDYRGNDDPGCLALVAILHALASVYADHPDFREEWRP